MKVWALCLLATLALSQSPLGPADCQLGVRWNNFFDNCIPECELEWIGNGECDPDCYQAQFEFDGGDCGDCLAEWIGDGNCDFLCDVEKYQMDGGDCTEMNRAR